MRPARRATRAPVAHSRSNSASALNGGGLSDENAVSHVGPQRTQLAHKASAANVLSRPKTGLAAGKENAVKEAGRVIAGARRVLGDVSNASKAVGGKQPEVSEGKVVLKPSRVRNASTVANLAPQSSTTASTAGPSSSGLSNAFSKNMKVGSGAATFGGATGRRVANALATRPSTQSLRNAASLGPAAGGKGSRVGAKVLATSQLNGGSQTQLATVAAVEDEIEVLEEEPLQMPGEIEMEVEEVKMEVDPAVMPVNDPGHAKVSLPDSVFAAVEAENQANTDNHDLNDDDVDYEHEELESQDGKAPDQNDLSLCKSDADDVHDLVPERDGENWLLLSPEEEKTCREQIAGIKRDFQEELDFWDTTMVAEYSDEIFEYMEGLEESTLPNPRYMDFQTEIEWHMRTTLIDWLLQVHMRYHMLPETLWIAINLVDRFLSKRVVSLVKLQLVGVTAMFVAAKYEEIMAPSVEEFVYMTENGYNREEILKGERIILMSLDFNISPYCSPYSWLRRISKADDYDIQTRTLSKFLMEVTLLDHRFLRAKPSMIAAIGMYTARKMLGGDWSEPFCFYSSYTEAQLVTPMQFLVENLADGAFEERFVYKKYSNKKFLKASIFARNFAVKYMAEGSGMSS